MAKKVIIDCDPGLDDALALFLAFHSPELDVKAVTAVSGNVPVGLGFENIRRLLSLLRPSEPPFIARGAERPFRGEPVHGLRFHGDDGLGGAMLDMDPQERWWKLFPGRADELISRFAALYPGEASLIAIGPLTNVAMGLKRDPDGMKKFKEILIMGGAVRTRGNVTPHAEFNVFADPLAAGMVLSSGLPITLFPLDVTHQVRLTSGVMEERLKPIDNAFTKFVVETTGYDADRRRFRDRDVFYLHDPLAVAGAIDKDLVTWEEAALSVETKEGERYGETSEIRGQRPGGYGAKGPKIEVCFGVHGEKFLNLFLNRL